MGIQGRIAVFRRLPVGTLLTLVLGPAEPLPDSLGELEGTTRVRVRGSYMGLSDAGLACPKVHLRYFSRAGYEQEAVFLLADVVRVENVCLPEAA